MLLQFDDESLPPIGRGHLAALNAACGRVKDPGHEWHLKVASYFVSHIAELREHRQCCGDDHDYVLDGTAVSPETVACIRDQAASLGRSRKKTPQVKVEIAHLEHVAEVLTRLYVQDFDARYHAVA